MRKSSGYVYIVQANNKVKIGASMQPIIRVRNIILGSGDPKSKSHISKETIDYYNMEREMHTYFGNKNTLGEWFNVGFDEAVKHLENIERLSTVVDIEIFKNSERSRYDKVIDEGVATLERAFPSNKYKHTELIEGVMFCIAQSKSRSNLETLDEFIPNGTIKSAKMMNQFKNHIKADILYKQHVVHFPWSNDGDDLTPVEMINDIGKAYVAEEFTKWLNANFANGMA